MQSMTVRGTASIAPLAEKTLLRESNLDAFKAGAPGGLQLLEASLAADRQNTTLLYTLAKGYNGYAIAVAETELLHAKLKQQDPQPSRELAVNFHTRAIAHVKNYMKVLGANWKPNDPGFAQQLQKHQSNQEFIDMAFVAAHSLNSLIDLQKEKPAALTYLPVATILADVACRGKLRPTYPTWGCEVMNAIELAAKPPVAGGDVSKSKLMFAAIEKQHPDELMPVALMTQYALQKQPNDEEWQRVKSITQKFRQQLFDWQKSIATSDQMESSPGPNALLTAAALRRLETIANHEKDFF